MRGFFRIPGHIGGIFGRDPKIFGDYRGLSKVLAHYRGIPGHHWAFLGDPRRILSHEPRTLQDSSYFQWIFGHLEDSRPFQGILGSLKCGIFQDAPQVPRPFQGNLKRSSGIFVDLRGSSRIFQDSPIFFRDSCRILGHYPRIHQDPSGLKGFPRILDG